MNTEFAQKPVIVTGLSGAGISSVLKTLEDLGREVFDNFPLRLVDPLLEGTSSDKAIAIGIDTRTRDFSAAEILKTAKKIDAKIVFITCDDEALYKRFAETRRRHPLAKNKPVSAGIKLERKLLGALQDRADLTIDSTHLSIHDLRHILEGHFRQSHENALTVTLMSFGFKHGSPREADIVMDVRFLKNPHWSPKLKPKTGLDEEVGAYIREDEEFLGFLQNFQSLIGPLLPRYAKEGKSYLTIAIGCTGGRHRSVYTTEQLSKWLKELGINVHVEHRDLKV